MRSFLIIYASLLLTACWQNVNRNDIESAIMICAARNEEVVSVSSSMIGAEVVTCSDRAELFINNETLTKAKRILSGEKNV